MTYFEIYFEAHNNAISLLDSSKILFAEKIYNHAYALAYTALEELAKSQFAADVFTGLKSCDDFKKYYLDHKKKIDSIKWAYYDAKDRPILSRSDIDDVEYINPNKPQFRKRNESLYIDIDFIQKKIIKPTETISEKDAIDIIHIVESALERIWEVSNEEFGTGRIGTKAFM